MFSRLIVMTLVCGAMAVAGFTIGAGTAASTQTQAEQKLSGFIDHPAYIALHAQKELGLRPDQIEALHEIRKLVESQVHSMESHARRLEKQMQDERLRPQLRLNRAAPPEAELEMRMAQTRVFLESCARQVASTLDEDQRQKLAHLVQERAAQKGTEDFPLMAIMQSRDALGISPQQFTRLQYLQADFIRAVAPIREQLELLQIEVHEKFERTGSQPPPEIVKRASELEAKVRELKDRFSRTAIEEVLTPEQRQKIHGHGGGAPPRGESGG